MSIYVQIPLTDAEQKVVFGEVCKRPVGIDSADEIVYVEAEARFFDVGKYRLAVHDVDGACCACFQASDTGIMYQDVMVQLGGVERTHFVDDGWGGHRLAA